MKLFGSLTEIISLVFRKNSQTVTMRPNQSTTYTAARDIQLPPGDTAHVLTSASSTQTLTGKTIDGDDNTVQDLPVTSLKTVLADANKAIVRDASGIPTSALLVDANVATGAAIDASKIANGTVSNTEFQRLDGVAAPIVTTTGSQALSNKSIDSTNGITANDSTFTIVDDADITKAAQFQASGITAGQTRVLTIPDASTTLVGTGIAQVITAKDIDGGTASNTSRLTVPKASSATLAALTRKEATLVYDTTLGKFLQDNGAALTALSGGSGSGEVNAVLNPSATDSLTGITDGTSHTTTRVTSGSPLDPATPTAFSTSATTTASESSTSGVYYTISTQPTGLRNRKLKVEFYFTTAASQTWALGVYSGSTRMALSTDSSGATLLPAGVTGKFTAYFDADSSTSYTVHLTRTAGSGTTALIWTNLIVGPGIQPQGAVVGEWQSYTPTIIGAGTVSNVVINYRRVGSEMEIDGYFQTGSPAASTPTMSLPSGMSINTTLIGAALKHIFGYYNMPASTQSVSQPGYMGGLVYDGSSSSTLQFIRKGNTDTQWLSELGNAIFDSNATITVRLRIPIAEWAGSGTVNLGQNDVEYASNSSTADTTDTTSFAYGPAGSTTPGALTTTRIKNVRFTTPILSTDLLVLEYMSTVAGSKWIPIVAEDVTYTGMMAIQQQGSNSYGMGLSLEPVDDYTVRVAFGRYMHTGGNATYGGGTSAWNSTGKWRVRKTAGGAAVGFGIASTTQAGLVNPYDANGIVGSGTYTPTVSNKTGVLSAGTATSFTAQYMRVGKVVTVSGKMTIQATGGGDGAFDLSLPVTTAFTAEEQGAGTIEVSNTASTCQGVKAVASSATVRCSINFGATSSMSGFFSFTYQVL